MFFSVPAEYQGVIHTHGVPVELYAFDLDPDPRRYFEIHEGITLNFSGDRFVVGNNVRTFIMETRLGRQIIVYSRCTKLDENNRCTIYPDRPATCRVFDESSVEYYNVPAGCIYDPGDCGEEFGV